MHRPLKIWEEMGQRSNVTVALATKETWRRNIYRGEGSTHGLTELYFPAPELSAERDTHLSSPVTERPP